jgi:hypothetical protein
MITTRPQLQDSYAANNWQSLRTSCRVEKNTADVQYGGKFQYNHWFLEIGFMLTARFLQEAMTIRNNVIWQKDTCSIRLKPATVGRAVVR